MFLKRVELQGFKSFADKYVINFDRAVTGVVGPNGCGKSNITEAIRWVLGEQSVKSLRSDKMTDVIFRGAESRRAVGMAEVNLVFDNTERSLNSDLDEIEITRRIYKSSGEAEYYINRNKVRLKDVIDLVLDTGLGKDSLSMISQGNIISIAEAKPADRRAIFEDAAGVSKYKKRKVETINKLERTKDNLERTFDILSELEKQVSPLKRQAKKAELYREKKQQLQEIEIAVLINEIENLTNDAESIRKILFDLEADTLLRKTNLEVMDTANSEAKNKSNILDQEIAKLQEDLMKTLNEIQTLETRKIEIDEKRKYAIETGDKKAKEKELENLLVEAKFEYEDRQNRYNTINAQVELYTKDLRTYTMDLIDKMQSVNENESQLRRLQDRKNILNNMIKEPFVKQQGVKAIIDNKSSLTGIHGVVGQIIKAQSGYDEALEVALGGAMYNIATETPNDARKAIEFLKKNHSGRATFLPIDVLRPNIINKEHYITCESYEGFIDIMANLVEYPEEFEPVINSLLANVVVVDNLQNGNKLANHLKYNYKIVTIDGDVIHKGGSMSGGKSKNQSSSLVTIQKEYDEINDKITNVEAKLELSNKEFIDTTNLKQELENKLTENRINLAKLEPVLEAKRAKYEKLQSDLDVLNPNNTDNEEVSFNETILTNLNKAYSERDNITTSIKLKRENKVKISAEIDRKEQQIRQVRREVDEFSAKEKEIIAKKVSIQTNLEVQLNRLASEYEMTFEYAKSKYSSDVYENAKDDVIRLRQEIAALGNINMNAPEEFSDVNERYEEMKTSYDDLCSSRDQMLQAIKEMDKIMIKQFKEMFDQINENINEPFVELFGGGKIKLVLEDPDDLLNTGVDIIAQPPGKAAGLNNLLSGGEKTLIAFCILFTILKVRKVPLVVFDEADAALDPGNVSRFSKYIKLFSESTQFIVVTHRAGTMSQCDNLFGVTMQDKGVSELVKVELVDAYQLTDNQENEG